MASTLPGRSVTLRLPPDLATTSVDDQADESYQLLELPPEILKRIEGSKDVFPLTIKGRPSDDAVLCTADTTFSLRNVSISNSLLVCRDPNAPSSSSSSSPTTRRRLNVNGDHHGMNGQKKPGPTLEVRDLCHGVLECLPQAPDLERIRILLKPSQWQGVDSTSLESRSESEEEDEDLPGTKRKRRSVNGTASRPGKVEKNGRNRKKVKRWTRAQLESVIQASDAELEEGLRERNVVEVDGRLLLLPPKHLVSVLNIILTLLTIHAVDTPTASSGSDRVATGPHSKILSSLSDDHDLPLPLGNAILGLFGSLQNELWTCRLPDMIRQIGLGLLEEVTPDGLALDEFIRQWKDKAGESWSDLVDIKMLQGNYILTETTASSFLSVSPTIIYFPVHSLPLNPAVRFADLFLTRQKWRPEEMEPFLKGLVRVGDTKGRDKLVGKFVRVVKDPQDGVWWYPRRAT